jgi:hypothetical protein
MGLTFEPILALIDVMRGFEHPWFVSGGWAIDLFAGRITRHHEDVEVGAFFPHQAALRRHLQDWDLFRISDGTWEPWDEADEIALPEFQVQARSDHPRLPVFDVFLNPLDRDNWVSRRHPDLRVPGTAIVRRTPVRGPAPGGVPYLAPEIQLLYKAKYHRPKDDADFDVVVDHLAGKARTWLRQTLEVHHPNDPWIARLRRPDR